MTNQEMARLLRQIARELNPRSKAPGRPAGAFIASKDSAHVR